MNVTTLALIGVVILVAALLSGDVVAVALFLQRLARPIGEHGQPQVEDRFVQERHRREDGQLDVLGGIAAAPCFLVGQLHRGPNLRAERCRVTHLLPMGPQTLARREQFLEDER